MVWQHSAKHVITSESRRRPDIVRLTSDEDVCVQVNFDFGDFQARSGDFDLWVKVID